MLKFGPVVRVGAAVAAGGLVLGLTAIPAGSQVVNSASLAASGTVECQVISGVYTWVFDYEATNTSQIGIPANVPAALGDIEITSQAVTLDGAPGGATNLVPNPVAVGQTATFHAEVPAAGVVGTVVTTIEWFSVDADDGGTEVVTLVLDDSCHAPASTTTTTTAPAVQAEAVAVTPSFTG